MTLPARPRVAWRRTGAVSALALAVALDVWATGALARAMGPANDLFPRWYGTRAWLLQGLDPYSPPVGDGIRAAMGTAPGEALGAFVFGFVYPGYVALLLVPLALLPFAWAAPAWLLLAQLATGAGAWLAWHAAGAERPNMPAAGRQPDPGGRRADAAPAILVALLFPASLLNLTFGQFAALVFAALAGAWFLLTLAPDPRRHRRREHSAGVLLALAFVKPAVALLPAAALLLWCLWQRRPRVAAAALLAGGVLLATSLLAIPGWPASFWWSTVDYARVASATSAAGLAAVLAGRATGDAVPPPVLLAACSLIAGALIAWGWSGAPRRAGDALGAGVLLGAWLVPPLYEWNGVLLLLPIVGWLRHRAGRALILATAGLLLASALTVPLVLRWPFESRLLWPAIALAAWTAPGLRRRRRGERESGPRCATLQAVQEQDVEADADAKKGLPIIAFATPTEWEAWLAAQHASAPGVWVKMAKKDSGITTVTYAEAIDGALCYGWIDGQSASFDASYWLQRFTPRGRRSKWSKINVEKVAELTRQGRMQPAGMAQVEQAQQDGRWAAAYDPPSRATVPDDLRTALDAHPTARAAFDALDGQNRYAILYRLQDARKPETRARRLQQYVDMLAAGKKLHA